MDFLIDELRNGKTDPTDPADPADLGRNLFGLGAYVGEVLVRNAGSTWIDLAEPERDYFQQRVGMRMADGMLRSPLSKVANRYEVGPEESLELYYLTLPGRVRARDRAPDRVRDRVQAPDRVRDRVRVQMRAAA
ncbi:hypothetical protein [Streptomyces sp. NPDC048442]|uniref:hypothetical protein n=1 Tax=Streptomyces sp. NPDC048442 TaxID=3154823 RepID=UPI0034172FFA